MSNLDIGFGHRKSLSIANNHPKPSQEFSEQVGPSIHKMEVFSRNSPPKIHPNFAQNLGRQILGNTFSGLKGFSFAVHQIRWSVVCFHVGRVGFTLSSSAQCCHFSFALVCVSCTFHVPPCHPPLVCIFACVVCFVCHLVGSVVVTAKVCTFAFVFWSHLSLSLCCSQKLFERVWSKKWVVIGRRTRPPEGVY